jgi:hypothetical protein
MGLKKYIFSALVLIIAIAAYVFTIESGDYRMVLGDTVVLLPIAVWVIAPALLLFIASIFHILYYSFKQYLDNRSISKDKDNLIETIKNNLSGVESNISFKSNLFNEIGTIVNQLKITISSDFESENKTINNLSKKIIQINNGEFTSLKEFKLPSNSTLVIKNNINRTKVDESYCMDILNKSNTFSEELIEAAFIEILNKKSFTTIKNIVDNIKLNKNMTIALLNTDSKYTDQFTFTSSEIIKFIENIDLSEKEYLDIAKNYTKRMSPDQVIKLFEDISSKDEKANEAYLYILFEYEMIDDIREIINNSQKDEYKAYKALLDLKDNGKQYTLDNLCYIKC